MNRVTIMGRLGADPEVRSFQNGGRAVSLRLATSEAWKDKSSGERRERTEWHRVEIYNETLGTIAEVNLRKGARVLIEGQLETRKWQDQSGQDRYTTEIALRPYRGSLQIIDWPAKEGGGPDFSDPAHKAGWEAQRPADDLDSEIPF